MLLPRLATLLLIPALCWATPAEEFTFQSTTPVKDLLNPPRKAPADWQQRSGAVSINADWEKDHAKPWFIELQREGIRWVQCGLASDNKDAIAWGLKQLQWGFQQMKPDGSFDCPDAFHSTSFLMETTSHAILLIESSPRADEFRDQLEAMKGPLLTCARWMISPANDKPAERQRIYTHRRFLLGCGLMECAMITHDSSIREKAVFYLDDGVRLQRDDGAFPEKGGHDSSYHSVGLIYLQRLLLIAPPDFKKPAWEQAAARGMAWLLGRIDETGTVSVEGNTRTGSGQEKGRTGAMKNVNLPEVATALLYRHQATRDEAWLTLARKVLTRK
jgi:hypothetical protein